jgi:endonuclease/exonuclease/phosphatase family metal-dependent hydrolase
MHVIRVATQNLWRFHGDWPARRPVLIDGLRELGPDVAGFQEAIVTDDYDQPLDLLGPGYEYVHHSGRDPDGSGNSIASRWPVGEVRELEAGTVAAEIEAPQPLGRLLYVNPESAYQKDRELEREIRMVEIARFVEAMLGDRPAHVILAGDLDAEPEAANLRFLRGLQSLGGMSVCYRDAWETSHPGEAGHTFTPENPTMPTGETGAWALEPGRRIDYVLVRCHGYGPTLDVRSCERLFDEPVGGAWASDHFGVMAELSCLLPDGRPVP